MLWAAKSAPAERASAVRDARKLENPDPVGKAVDIGRNQRVAADSGIEGPDVGVCAKHTAAIGRTAPATLFSFPSRSSAGMVLASASLTRKG